MSKELPKHKIEIDLDALDDLPVQEQFHLPTDASGAKIYLCGHSLGLASRKTEAYLLSQLLNWKNLGVSGHFEGDSPWISYSEDLEMDMARIVGANKDEVVIMNSLTANIHFLFSGFYRPTTERYKVIVEADAFSSDHYAITSHLEVRGINPQEAILLWHPNKSTGYLEIKDLLKLIKQHPQEIAMIFVSGVQYLNGQFLDIESIVALAHQYDIIAGFDLAHAAGNVPLDLHGWKVDFACWCTYKYLNGGPGNLGGVFIHNMHDHRHIHFKGWWGNAIENRFDMLRNFTPSKGAAGWQVSNPPVLALPALKASLETFNQFGMEKIRRKSILLTGYLADEIENVGSTQCVISSPRSSHRRGAMLCLRLNGDSKKVFQSISDQRIIVDFRRPDTIRVAPHPLYNTFGDCHKFVVALAKALS